MIALIAAKRSTEKGFLSRIKGLWAKPSIEHILKTEDGISVEYDLIHVLVPCYAGERRKEKLAKKLKKLLERCGSDQLVFSGDESYYFRAKLRAENYRAVSDFELKKAFWPEIFDALCEKVTNFEKAVAIDYEGREHTGEILFSLCEKFRNVSVITANEARFESLREQIMEKTGAALQFYSHLSAAEGAGLAVLCSGGDRQLFRLARLKDAAVFHFSPDLPNFYYGMKHVNGCLKVSIKETGENMFPEEFPPEQIASAIALQNREKVKKLFTLQKIE